MYLFIIYSTQSGKSKKKKNFQQYHREFSIPLSITFIRIQHLLGPEKEGIFTMKVCHVGRHSKTVLCRQQKDNSFSTTAPLFSFSSNGSQIPNQIFVAQFHNVHRHDYQPIHKQLENH